MTDRPDRWVTVVNPGAGRTAIDVDRLMRIAHEERVDLDIHVTESISHVDDVVKASVGGGATCFAAVGGDGTAHVLANAILKHAGEGVATIAVIASGSGSDLVRTFGHRRGLEEGIRRLRDPDRYAIDVGRIVLEGEAPRYFLNAVNVGVGARSAHVAERLPRWLGGLRYIAAFWIALAGYRLSPIAAEVGRHRFNDVAINVVVANGQFFGGGMNIAPRASMADGLFDVQVFAGRKRQAFAVMPRVVRGTHLAHRAVRRYVGTEVTIRTQGGVPVEADGELIGTGSVAIDIVPGAIELVI